MWLAGSLGGVGGVAYQSPLDTALSAGFAPFVALAGAVFAAPQGRAVFLIAVSGLFIFFALFLLVKVLRTALHTRVESTVNDALGRSAVLAMLIGAAGDGGWCSRARSPRPCSCRSGGAGLLRLEQAFPVTIGANIGTHRHGPASPRWPSPGRTPPPRASRIALVHLLFNLGGLAIIYPVRRIRRVPLDVARGVTRLALRSRKLTVVWVALLFYGLPSLCIAVARWLP